MSLTGPEFGIVMPSQMYYGFPNSLPAGLKGFYYRTPNQNTIPTAGPAGTPSGQEIIIQINESAATVLDPSKSKIYLEMTFNGTMTLPVAANNTASPLSCIYVAASDSNGGFIGSAASTFNRYQVKLNNAVYSDDINEFGMAMYLQYLLNYTSEQRLMLSRVLGLNASFPSGIWGAAFHGRDLGSRATITATGQVTSTTLYNTLAGTQAATQYNNAEGIFIACPGSTQSAMVLTFVQNYNFAIHLPGMLGFGNDRMVPLFCGPIQISLFTDAVDNYFHADFALEQPNVMSLYGPYTQFTWTTHWMAINSAWFECELYKLDVPTFNALMSGLPRPNQFIFRTTTINSTGTNLAAGVSGQSDILVSIRRASLKSLIIMASPSNIIAGTVPTSASTTGLAIAGTSCNLWGKYGSVCPNLGSNTCILVNGTQYPQQGNDPMSRPATIYTELLDSLTTWADMNTKPSILPQNFFVTDSINNVSMGTITAANTVPMALNVTPNSVQQTNNGISQWRQLYSTTFRFALANQTGTLAAAVSTQPMIGGGWAYPFYPISAGTGAAALNQCIVAPNGSTPLGVNNNISMTDKTLQYSVAANTYLPNNVHFLEGTSSVDPQLQNAATSFVLPGFYKPTANQFLYACKMDQLSKPDTLAGMSTLTGNFYFRANIILKLLQAYALYFFAWSDMLVVLDVGTRQVAVRY
jgi:hypothetical protein